jgi:hypothetical protein
VATARFIHKILNAQQKINLINNEEYNNNHNHERDKYFWVNNPGKNPMWENPFFCLWNLIMQQKEYRDLLQMDRSNQ